MDQTRYPQTDCYYKKKNRPPLKAAPANILLSTLVRLNDVMPFPYVFAGIKCLIESDRWI